MERLYSPQFHDKNIYIIVFTLVYTIKVSVITVGILHMKMLSFERFVRNWLNVKHFLQILQNLEFTDAKFLLWSWQKLDSVRKALGKPGLVHKCCPD
jgi:hypothetical protein